MAEHRHKREANARRLPRAALVAGPIALLATASAVTIGVVASNPGAPALLAQPEAAAITQPLERQPVSRSQSRLTVKVDQAKIDAKLAKAATAKAVRGADTKLWTTTVLNLWSESTEAAEQPARSSRASRSWSPVAGPMIVSRSSSTASRAG